MDTAWYLRRLSRMRPREVMQRGVAAARIREMRGEMTAPPVPRTRANRTFDAALPEAALDAVPEGAGERLLATADRFMDGYGDYFGTTRHDMISPDWSRDPRSGRRAPEDVYAFDIDYRDQRAVGDVKQLWEPSRHQHLTVLAAAYALTGEQRYAQRVAEHLKSWWAANPPMHGVHWVSGIELGIRLLSWVWVRRLLDSWPSAPELFERNDEALHQIWHHQRWLATFASYGSSANNHAVAESAGQLAASCAFDWFEESRCWRDQSMRTLDEHLRSNTFHSGINRELATEYHGLVLELGLAAAVEANAAGIAVPDSTWRVLLRMTDALAAIVDRELEPPRQGDGDGGHGLVLDGTGSNRWASLLASGETLFGARGWWPRQVGADVRTVSLAALAQRYGVDTVSATLAHDIVRPSGLPAHFADAGLTILRTPDEEARPEIWCRCDGGPHGFLSIAAHAHADALSVELRHGSVDVLADPGTYCYHGEPEWRNYFRSTLAHNTLELDGKDQSRSGGPFLWTRHARSRVLVAHSDPAGVSRWCGEHTGYSRGRGSVTHRRSVQLDSVVRELRVTDEVRTASLHSCVLAFHLGPTVRARLSGNLAVLTWARAGRECTAVLRLPEQLCWSARVGERTPPLGWYSPGFGVKRATTVLLGTGELDANTGALNTVLELPT